MNDKVEGINRVFAAFIEGIREFHKRVPVCAEADYTSTDHAKVVEEILLHEPPSEVDELEQLIAASSARLQETYLNAILAISPDNDVPFLPYNKMNEEDFKLLQEEYNQELDYALRPINQSLTELSDLPELSYENPEEIIVQIEAEMPQNDAGDVALLSLNDEFELDSDLAPPDIDDIEPPADDQDELSDDELMQLYSEQLDEISTESFADVFEEEVRAADDLPILTAARPAGLHPIEPDEEFPGGIHSIVQNELFTSLNSDDAVLANKIHEVTGVMFSKGKCEVDNVTIETTDNNAVRLSSLESERALDFSIDLAMRSALYALGDEDSLEQMSRDELKQLFVTKGLEFDICATPKDGERIQQRIKETLGIEKVNITVPDQDAQQAQDNSPDNAPRPR